MTKSTPKKVILNEADSTAHITLESGNSITLKELSAAKLMRVPSVMDVNGLSGDVDAMFAIGYLAFQGSLSFNDFLDLLQEVADVERLAEAINLFPNLQRKLRELSAVPDGGPKHVDAG
jgi:hypothetical protein